MSENNELQKLNPQIRELEIGIRDLRKVKVYPLSLAHQLSLDEIITKVIVKFDIAGTGDLDPEVIMSFFFKLVKDNIESIIGFVIDEEEILKDITNEQLSKLVLIIYDVNYEPLIKNVQSLSEKIKAQFQLERPSQQFANVMDTAQTDSSSADILKEELQEVS